MTQEFLLKAQLSLAKSKEKQVYKIPFTRIYNKQGFAYIKIHEKKARKIRCAIELSKDYTNEEAGRYWREDASVYSREPIDMENELLLYKCSSPSGDLILFIKSFSVYNDVAKQYLYFAEGLREGKEGFIQPIVNVLGYSSFDILASLPGYTVYPRHAYFDSCEGKQVFLNVFDRESAKFQKVGNDPGGLLAFEKAEFFLVNYTRGEVLKFLTALDTFSINDRAFGFVSFPQIEEVNSLHEASALQNPIIKISFTLSYNLKREKEKESDKFLRYVFFIMKETK